MNRVQLIKGKLKLTPTDHFTLILTLHKLERIRTKKEKIVTWNLNKRHGWQKYLKSTEKDFDYFKNFIDDYNNPIDKVISKFEKIVEKLKYEAFGKMPHTLMSGPVKQTGPDTTPPVPSPPKLS